MGHFTSLWSRERQWPTQLVGVAEISRKFRLEIDKNRNPQPRLLCLTNKQPIPPRPKFRVLAKLAWGTSRKLVYWFSSAHVQKQILTAARDRCSFRYGKALKSALFWLIFGPPKTNFSSKGLEARDCAFAHKVAEFIWLQTGNILVMIGPRAELWWPFSRRSLSPLSARVLYFFPFGLLSVTVDASQCSCLYTCQPNKYDVFASLSSLT
jgi:hypothetical protein